ncbi:hypothetical protein GIB67_008938, partial [Kingdonia uniflora]
MRNKKLNQARGSTWKVWQVKFWFQNRRSQMKVSSLVFVFNIISYSLRLASYCLLDLSMPTCKKL